MVKMMGRSVVLSYVLPAECNKASINRISRNMAEKVTKSEIPPLNFMGGEEDDAWINGVELWVAEKVTKSMMKTVTKSGEFQIPNPHPNSMYVEDEV